MSRPTVDSILERLAPVNPDTIAPPAFVTRAQSVTVTVYYLDNPTQRQLKAVLGALTMVGRSPDITPVKWQSFVLTWSCVVFPELVSAIRESATNEDYRLEAFSTDFVDSCVNSILAQGSADTVGDKFLTFPPGLPVASLIPMNATLAAACSSIEGLYAYYAMVIYIMGKSLSVDSIAAIAIKRPDALIRKRRLQASEYILKGDGRLSQDNYGNVQSGWVRSTRPRIVVVKHLAALYASDSKPETLDPIVVNMDMLRNSGQNYLYYIYDLLVSCEWCIEIPALAAAYRHFSRMVFALTKYPTYLQPFVKLMLQDSTKDIRRRDIEMLICVAIFYAAQTRSSMVKYRVSPEGRAVIQAFIQKAAERGITFSDVVGQATIEVTTV